MKELVKRYFEEFSAVESNIKSFNNFVEFRLQVIVDELSAQLDPSLGLKLGKISVGKPIITEADGSKKDLFPFEARLRKITYSAPIFLEINLHRGNEKEFFNARICDLPIMVKSKFCHLSGLKEQEMINNYEDPADPGGYFILNGNERVLVLIEDLAPNQPFVEKDSSGNISARLFSERGSYRIPLNITENKEGEIQMSFTRFKNLPVIPVIKALGLVRDSEIFEEIGKEYDSLIVNLYSFSSLQKEEDAIIFLVERMNLSGTKPEMIDRVTSRLDSFLLPHIGTDKNSRKDKARTLCKLVKHLLLVSRDGRPVDDKDHYLNKRVRLSGDLLTDLFRINLSILTRDMQHTLERFDKKKKFYSAKIIVKPSLLSRRIESAMATGSWIGEKKGITQNIQRTNYLDLFSQIQRVVSLLPSEQENFKARTLHPTHYGRLCPIETPEGTSIGLRKNLAILARISTAVNVDESVLLGIFEEAGMMRYAKKEKEKVSESESSPARIYDVFLNGKVVGKISSLGEFASQLRERRRRGELPLEGSVYADADKEAVFVSTEVGRVLRPLIILKEGRSQLEERHKKEVEAGRMGWKDLIKLGIVEFLDAAEEENSLVAFTEADISPLHSHLEVDPIAQFGLISSLVPFSNFCQSARLNRGSKTQKQSLGLYTTNFPVRLDTDISLLHYPQKPIVRSFVQGTLKHYPAGQNVVVAVLSYEGYNMQDALVINAGSLQRGLARSTYFRPYETEELYYAGGLADEITIPSKDVVGYKTENSYRHLDDDGIAHKEAYARENDVVIGKTSPPKFLTEIGEISMAKIRKENSVTMRQEEKGVVDDVFISISQEGNRIIQLRTRDPRIPEVGDKFSSRHGQKGVLSALVPEQDMPYSERGMKPDILFSPHSLPSRMTVSHLIELLAGKVGALSGRFIDGTAFSSERVEDLEKELRSFGFREDGKETLYDPRTGKKMEAKIYIGNMYYLKLEYMVANKLHARSFGRVTLLTRQPVEGRSKGGALRLGEMEKDALIGHGAALLLKERYDSDKVVIYICEKCDVMAIHNYAKETNTCPLCGESANIEPVEVSYAFKLLLEELTSLHIMPRLELKSKYE
ncbi:MAG TPA: DNA-directed RNA polymerase subunit B'' [Nanoarchaeota archaeon]|nr:MAG: DNA-directed RNA polymerase subunit B [archaeon GW2011_AR6]HIH51207.1 DNA-directed RNA polymerase subunit B'' [Nanoarchaeota archaeon]